MVRINFEIDEVLKIALVKALREEDLNVRRFFTQYAKDFLRRRKK